MSVSDEAELAEAISLAALAHGAAMDKVGQPYIFHPLRVMLRLGPHATKYERMAAVLHDVVEDTSLELVTLQSRRIPPEVLAAVDALTRREGEVFADYIRRCAQNDIARRVKMRDIEDNTDKMRPGGLPPEAKSMEPRYNRARDILFQIEADFQRGLIIHYADGLGPAACGATSGTSMGPGARVDLMRVNCISCRNFIKAAADAAKEDPCLT